MSETENKPTFPTKAQTKKHEMLSPMLDSAILEMREFSKKKQDGIINETKVKILNRLLKDLKWILENEPSIEYLDLLDEESLPQNSDAVLILGQYQAAMRQYRVRHYRNNRWLTQELYEEQQEALRKKQEAEEEYDDDDEDDEYEDDEENEELEDDE